MHVIAGKAICLREAAQPEFRAYAENVVKNAKALAEALLAHGFDLVTGGTDNHLMLADLRKKNITGKELRQSLTRCTSPSTKTPSRTTRRSPASPAACASVRPRAPRAALRRRICRSWPDCIDKIATDYEANR